MGPNHHNREAGAASGADQERQPFPARHGRRRQEPDQVEQQAFHLLETTVADIHSAYRSETLTAHRLVQMYLDRIEAYDKKARRSGSRQRPNEDRYNRNVHFWRRKVERYQRCVVELGLFGEGQIETLVDPVSGEGVDTATSKDAKAELSSAWMVSNKTTAWISSKLWPVGDDVLSPEMFVTTQAGGRFLTPIGPFNSI
jgi:hypothetical protein